MKRLALALLLASSPALAQQSPEEVCRYKIYNITNNLPHSPRSSEEANHKLDIARPFRKAAAECSAKFPALAALKTDADKQWAAAEAEAKELQRVEGVQAREAELRQKAEKAESEADLAAIIDEAAKGDPGLRTEQLARTIQYRREALTRKQIAADEQRLREGAVTARLGLAPDDSYDQQKIQDAFARMAPEDFVVTIPRHGEHRYQPSVTDHYAVDKAGDHGEPAYFLFRGRMIFGYDNGPHALPEITPGLIWNVINDDTVVFVTADGGRYLSSIHGLMNGVPRPESWPTDLTNHALAPKDVAALAEAKLLPAATAKTLAAESAAAEACADKVWAAAKPRFDAIDVADISSETRRNRADQLADKTWDQVRASCGGHEKAAQKAWKDAIAARDKDRKATLARARARLAEIAAAHAGK